MDRMTLDYLASIMVQDASSVSVAVMDGTKVPDEELKRVINSKLDALKADIANIQHFIESV